MSHSPRHLSKDWLECEKHHLRWCLANGDGYTAIAEDLGRSIADIKRMSCELGIAKWIAIEAGKDDLVEVSISELQPAATKKEYSESELIALAKAFPYISGLASVSKVNYRKVGECLDFVRRQVAT